ncbi:MAG: hypothetical protein HUU55_13635 [Myxococcales bacterium]|nr:hypothetical protein [Myxococcales bacterium]
MDLLDRMIQTAFLGKEYLTWLWYRSDSNQGRFQLEGSAYLEVWFDDKLVLDTAVEKVKEVNSIRGEAPTETAEAKAAIRMGKKVADARLRVIKDGREWMCNIKGEELALSGVKVPAVLSRDEDEQVLERLGLIEELEGVLDGLYAQFMNIRLDSEQWAAELATIQAWAHQDHSI